MPSSRTARTVVRFMLAWFALYLGAAVAAPLLTPGGYAVVCSADGIARLVQTDDTGAPDEAHASLHCPLCVPAGAPPPAAVALAATPLQVPACVLPAAADVWPSALTAGPPPARGPPPSN